MTGKRVASQVDQARAFFPRGLSQPKRGFRFAVDALLLASFAAKDKGQRVLDLGTGCGVVGLTMALMHPHFFITGLDLDLSMLGHAQSNAVRLGLVARFGLIRADVRHRGGLKPESMDVVVCNPPYRELTTGRACLDQKKTQARFQKQGGLDDFIQASFFFLGNRKSSYFIYLAEAVDELLTSMRELSLQPKELLFVHPLADRIARLVLVRAVKNGAPGLRVLAPLIMHELCEGGVALTTQALSFCPWLACNPTCS
ncbi:MAG: methyltransferase [Desulfovibrionales bacterium]|jgi:tRNA1Val (adenine37-N6)-methyltransferase|nr:methyltransferase [Desulfovibrionales bacterium]